MRLSWPHLADRCDAIPPDRFEIAVARICCITTDPRQVVPSVGVGQPVAVEAGRRPGALDAGLNRQASPGRVHRGGTETRSSASCLLRESAVGAPVPGQRVATQSSSQKDAHHRPLRQSAGEFDSNVRRRTRPCRATQVPTSARSVPGCPRTLLVTARIALRAATG
jgi:hypothetical protein